MKTSERWRIRRAKIHLERAADSIARAKGELRPKGLAEYNAAITKISDATEKLLGVMDSVSEDDDVADAAE